MSDTVLIQLTLMGNFDQVFLSTFLRIIFSETVYETPYSLLDNLSPAYREAFGNHLTDQLLKLQKQREEENSD